METKICTGCGTEYPLTSEYYHSNGYQPSGAKRWKARCKSCSKANVKDRMAKLIAEVFPVLECSRCGYNKCKRALEFHHVDPSTKEHTITRLVYAQQSREVTLAELRKCVLLCANCHREVHEELGIAE